MRISCKNSWLVDDGFCMTASFAAVRFSFAAPDQKLNGLEQEDRRIYSYNGYIVAQNPVPVHDAKRGRHGGNVELRICGRYYKSITKRIFRR
jgi:hypothetical protein